MSNNTLFNKNFNNQNGITVDNITVNKQTIINDISTTSTANLADINCNNINSSLNSTVSVGTVNVAQTGTSNAIGTGITKNGITTPTLTVSNTAGLTKFYNQTVHYAGLSSPNNTISCLTPATSTNSTVVATTAYVKSCISGINSFAGNVDISGTLVVSGTSTMKSIIQDTVNNNTWFGSNLGNKTGTYNCAFGKDAILVNATGKNTGIGSNALRSSTSYENTALGYDAGRNLSSGSSNTFLGMNTDTTNGSVTKSTAIGYGATITGSNQVVLGTATENVIISGNVGVGKTTPTVALDVSGNSNITGTLTCSNFACNTGISTFNKMSSATNLALNGTMNLVLENAYGTGYNSSGVVGSSNLQISYQGYGGTISGFVVYGGGNGGQGLIFNTYANNGASITEKMRIDSDGVKSKVPIVLNGGQGGGGGDAKYSIDAATDTNSQKYSLTSGTPIYFPNFSGFVMVNCLGSGSVQCWLCGAGLISQITYCNTQTGSLFYDAPNSRYGFSPYSTADYTFFTIRMRNGA